MMGERPEHQPIIEPTLYELSAPGRQGVSLPDCDVPRAPLPETGLRADNGQPELSESQVVRHFLHLSQHNFGVDTGFYPLGSCTMKHNPKINEQLARLPGFGSIHPLQDEVTVQGALKIKSRFSAIRVPHSGRGGCAPIPRNPSAATSRIALEKLMVA